jgi:hypothetical protein
MFNCEVSAHYGKDELKTLHFHCTHCGQEMHPDEERVCKAVEKICDICGEKEPCQEHLYP